MTSYYTDLPFMAHSSCSYCMDLPSMVFSIDSSTVCGQLQFFRLMQLSSLTSSDAASDGFINLQFETITQTVAETVLKFLVLSSKKFISWRMLTKFQQGRQSRVGQSFVIE